MRKNTIFSLCIFASLFLTVGCATIVSDSDYLIKIDSSVQNAKVTIKNANGVNLQTATTPTSVKLSAGGDWKAASYMFHFEKVGYESTVVAMASETDGWFFGNFLLGGILGLVIDASSGAMWKLKDQVYANMNPIPDYNPPQFQSSAHKDTQHEKKQLQANQNQIGRDDLLHKQSPLQSRQKNTGKTRKLPTNQFDNIAKKLLKLKELKKLGILTDEEYEVKRKALADKI